MPLNLQTTDIPDPVKENSFAKKEKLKEVTMGTSNSCSGSCIIFTYLIITLCLFPRESEAQGMKTDNTSPLPRSHVLLRSSVPQDQPTYGLSLPEPIQVLSRIEVGRGMYDSLGQLHSSAGRARPSNSFGVPNAASVRQRKDTWFGKIPSDATQSHAGDELIRMVAIIAIDATLAHFHYRGALPPYPYDR